MPILRSFARFRYRIFGSLARFGIKNVIFCTFFPLMILRRKHMRGIRCPLSSESSPLRQFSLDISLPIYYNRNCQDRSPGNRREKRGIPSSREMRCKSAATAIAVTRGQPPAQSEGLSTVTLAHIPWANGGKPKGDIAQAVGFSDGSFFAHPLMEAPRRLPADLRRRQGPHLSFCRNVSIFYVEGDNT